MRIFKKFVPVLVCVTLLCTLYLPASSLDEEAGAAVLSQNAVIPDNTGTISTEAASELLLKKYPDFINNNLVNLGSLGEYELFYNVTEYYTFMDYDVVMGDYTFDVFQQQSPYDIGLYVINSTDAYTLAEAFDGGLINISDVYSLIKSNPQYKYNFRISPNSDTPSASGAVSTETARELLLKKYPDFITNNLVNLGSLGEYDLFYNVTDNYTFMDYDVVMGDYSFDVFQQQSPYDIGLYVINSTDAYTLAEAFDGKLIDISDVYSLIKSNPQYKYNFRIVANNETPSAKSENKPELAENSVSLKAGKTSKITVKNKDNITVKYKSSDAKVAKVSKKGKVTALNKGTALITVKAGNSKLKYKVTVTSAPKLGSKSVTVKKGNKVKVKIIGKAKTTDNKYTNTKYAKITSEKSANNLNIRGVKKGKTTLKIKVNGVKTLKLTVKVV